MALARTEARREGVLYTLDVDPNAQRAAQAHARAGGVAELIVFVRGTLAAFVRAYPHLRPALTFVDGDHTETGVARDLAVLESLVPAGGLLVFHDFNDPLNDDPNCSEIKVRPVVEASWVARECDFTGVFGCCGVFRRRVDPAAKETPIVDLLRLDSLRNQYLHRLRYPAGRFFKRIMRRR